MWSIEGTILASAAAYLNVNDVLAKKKRQISLARCENLVRTRVFTIHDDAARARGRCGGGGSIAFVRILRVGAKGEAGPWGEIVPL